MEKNGTFSLFETSVNGYMTCAYIMTFHRITGTAVHTQSLAVVWPKVRKLYKKQ